jgi:hypothetical protein
MLDWQEFVAKEHQRELLREAQSQRLIRELRAARQDVPSRLRVHFKKRAQQETRRQCDACPDAGGI